ncbi:MAG TPA: citrate transporter [Ignavibacteria bacterium]|nr:citrate transporter [Ignavibacteria bacterium]
MLASKKFHLLTTVPLLIFLSTINLFGASSSAVLSETKNIIEPSIFMVLPFVILLLLIATGPLFYKHLWERHYPKISILLGLVTLVYYLYVLNDYESVLHIFTEYVSFIALLSSLFVASGGILIKVDKEATPLANVLFLLLGAVIANVIGTTGAAMLLIRPFIKMNEERIKPYHIIFFIFLVSNVGGALTPIGDPPLFIGFLRGVPFFWVIENVWYIWAPTVLLILLVFYFIDKRNKSGEENIAKKKYTGAIEFKGAKNLIYLVVIILAVFIDPNVMSWVPSLSPLPFGIREVIMFGVVYLSYKNAHPDILKANEFDFEPIKEVAYLFVGIFLTMVPALQLIANFAQTKHELLNTTTFYWATGSLSAVLDNTPTYLNFLSAAMGKFFLDVNVQAQVLDFVSKDDVFLRAISVSAVFFGAMTYIGNGPNFMVKSISERAGIEMPSFFAYVFKYSIPILVPIYVLVWLVFFR